jgi:hypothetical protein
MKKPPHWFDVYPQNTKEGDEEAKVFTALARNNKWDWRSVSALAKETGLDKKRIEEILYKYMKKSMIFQNPKNDEQFGYWSNLPDMISDSPKSIKDEDLKNRLN